MLAVQLRNTERHQRVNTEYTVILLGTYHIDLRPTSETSVRIFLWRIVRVIMRRVYAPFQECTSTGTYCGVLGGVCRLGNGLYLSCERNTRLVRYLVRLWGLGVREWALELFSWADESLTLKDSGLIGISPYTIAKPSCSLMVTTVPVLTLAYARFEMSEMNVRFTRIRPWAGDCSVSWVIHRLK